MQTPFRRPLCHDAERHLFIKAFCKRAIDNEVYPFGGVARDLWLRNRAAKRFHEHMVSVRNGKYHDDACNYYDQQTHTESYADRVRQPNDVDLIVGMTEDINSHTIRTEFLSTFASKFEGFCTFDSWHDNTSYVHGISGMTKVVYSTRIHHRYGSMHTGFRHFSVKVDLVMVPKDQVPFLLLLVPIHVSRLMLTAASYDEYWSIHFEYEGLTDDIKEQMIKRETKIDRNIYLNLDSTTAQKWMQQIVHKIAKMTLCGGWKFSGLPCINFETTVNSDGVIGEGRLRFQLFRNISHPMPTEIQVTDDEDDPEITMINMGRLMLQ